METLHINGSFKAHICCMRSYAKSLKLLFDFTGGTRTCIHTPSEPLEPDELTPEFENILRDASAVYFDGRLTEAAILLAKAARNKGKSQLCYCIPEETLSLSPESEQYHPLVPKQL